jgi:hypothetical protein
VRPGLASRSSHENASGSVFTSQYLRSPGARVYAAANGRGASGAGVRAAAGFAEVFFAEVFFGVAFVGVAFFDAAAFDFVGVERGAFAAGVRVVCVFGVEAERRAFFAGCERLRAGMGGAWLTVPGR